VFFAHVHLFFSFLGRRPPLPILVPYTTLFRSLAFGTAWRLARNVTVNLELGYAFGDGASYSLDGYGNKLSFSNGGRYVIGWRLRSEEHTSELQSRENLVCRLLLEKKKKSN